MSQENVEIVRQFVLRTNEGDWDAAVSNVAAEAEWDWRASRGPDSGVYRGPEEWCEWMIGRFGELDARFDVVEIRDVPPDIVVVVAHMTGRGRASGVEIAARGALVFTLRDGQVTRATLYQTKDQALKAFGLEE